MVSKNLQGCKTSPEPQIRTVKHGIEVKEKNRVVIVAYGSRLAPPCLPVVGRISFSMVARGGNRLTARSREPDERNNETTRMARFHFRM